jgi:hypothetical protein
MFGKEREREREVVRNKVGYCRGVTATADIRERGVGI